ncbi:hypothetical protein [Nostoc sp.]|uniref:hypothetical protein n=1 Tax=Nostoc sp. TaxID=1180 RepID=UPI002FF49058
MKPKSLKATNDKGPNPFNPPLAGRGVETLTILDLERAFPTFNPPLAGRGVETLRSKPLICQQF